MTDCVLHRDNNAIALPAARVEGGALSVRSATMDDIPFIDELQKKHSKMVGWFPTKWVEKNIEEGCVLVAEKGIKGSGHQGIKDGADATASMPRCPGASVPVGYVIARDKYMKREDCGIIYQLNVTPGSHRKLVGATLIKEVFHRAAYGCKLFCCWCAQDIEANYFWESIGFVPLAFRTGSRQRTKSAGGGPRIHIFWQRRVREGDDGAGPGGTPYWFPSETTGGAVRENRIVLPIPPGTHWRDAKPAVLPGMARLGEKALESDEAKATKRQRSRSRKKPKVTPPPAAASGGLWFAPPEGECNGSSAKSSEAAKPPEGGREGSSEPQLSPEEKEAKRQARRNDPKLVAAARELRDRYTEQINAPGSGLLLPPSACGKYDVSRQFEEAPSVMNIEREDGPTRLLDAA